MEQERNNRSAELTQALNSRGLTRRNLLAAFAASTAMIALKEGASAAPYSAQQVRALAQETGAAAKLVIANGQDLDEADPHYFKSIPSYYLMANAYDNLFGHPYVEQEDGGLTPEVDENDDWVLEPWLVESWETSEDEKVLTFHLREGLTFQDGSPLTAQDVKATFDRGVSPTSVYSNLVFNLMTITSPDQIAAPDDLTVVLTLEQPTAFAYKILATNVFNIMSAAALEEHATEDDPTAHQWFSKNTFGSAAYTLTKWTPGVEWELSLNENFWNKDAVLNGGVLNRTIPSPQERLSLLVNGDVDIAFDLLPKDLSELASNPDIAVLDFEIPWPQYLGMNNRIPPFDNVDVRRAVSHAIPYQTIIDQVMYGYAKPLKSPCAEGMPTSDPSFWAYDGGPERAREILEGLGLSDFSFDIAVRNGFPTHEQIAVWIQSSMMEAGANVNILKMTDAEYLEKFNSGALQSWVGEWYSWINDPIYHLNFNFHSAATATNGAGYSNPQVDELIDAAMYEPDKETRDQMSRDIQQIIVDEAPWGLLYQINYVVATRANVSGFQYNPDTTSKYWLVSKS
ncbi:MAG: ABC transporter substrate-binding protein [Thermomicrobiales bacterium]|nr:ABC transporter substrate-binding protein [Thermomicrobiales bacterium]MCO5222187.1 ABC transporter substrate-binding protein [Thermomicrobiales bacterium]